MMAAYHANEPPREVTKVNRALTVTDDFTTNPPRKNQSLSKPWLNPTPSTSEAAKSANFKTPKKLIPKTSAEATESTETITRKRDFFVSKLDEYRHRNTYFQLKRDHFAFYFHATAAIFFRSFVLSLGGKMPPDNLQGSDSLCSDR
ncbi:hypothetical protein GWI33_019568 [Rhynchophorus ferrugineus]|uniref:Uncharacterized protein n=1 Tax=Rhynchophorus ferrugineus TaxID=354439 RepID=A0A834M6W8_RHYFE|nr:hypothetical protein GWI33_019568 [Rhynchophorus ferrugineus]